MIHRLIFDLLLQRHTKNQENQKGHPLQNVVTLALPPQWDAFQIRMKMPFVKVHEIVRPFYCCSRR